MNLNNSLQNQKIKYPVIESLSLSDNETLLYLFLPETILYFEGHFPNNPILPGVIQIHWAIEYSKRYFHVNQPFKQLEVVKFQNVIKPNTRLQLKLEHSVLKLRTIFSYFNTQTFFSSGRILWNNIKKQSQEHIYG
jgi:3-hydroxymyristoyl/3-hydroxydecanoyl-(acyl carrier protein) dehydratase